MKTQKFIALPVLIAILLASCGSPTPAANTQPAEPTTPPQGTTITVAVQAGAPEVVIYQELSKVWEQQTGNTIQWVEIPQENIHDKLLIELSSSSTVLDATGISQPWIAEFAAAGYIEPLDDRLSAEDKADFGASVLAATSYNDKIYGVPHYMFAPIMYYRIDLFEKYGLRKPTIEQPLTKEEFLAATTALTADGNFGTIVEAKRHVTATHHMIEYIYREGGQIVDENRVAHVNSPEAVTALQFMVDLVNTHKVAPPGALEFNNTDNHTLFSQGKLGMAINWPYAYSMISDPAQSQVADKFALALPFKAVKTTSIAGGWSLGLVKNGKNKEVAWEWVKWVTSTDQLYNLRKKNFAPPVRQSELAKLQADPEITEAQQEALAVMLAALANGTPVPSIPEISQIIDRLNIALQEAIGLQKTPQEALDAAQVDIEKILNK